MTRAATAHTPPRAVMAGFAFVILGIAATAAAQAVDSTPQHGIPPGVAACTRENRTVREIVRGMRQEGFFQGGLGGMSNGTWKSWGCWRKHACLDSIGLANKGEAVCYKRNSADESWMLWGLQRDVGVGCKGGALDIYSRVDSQCGVLGNFSANLARSCHDITTGTYTKQCITGLSSTHMDHLGSGNANDGDISGSTDFHTGLAHTGMNSEIPWWRVDFGDNFVASVKNVTIYNRPITDCCGDRLDGYSLYVGNSSNWTQNVACAEGLPAPLNPPPNNFAVVPCHGVGRYLHLVIPRNGAIINVLEIMASGCRYTLYSA